MFGSSVEPIIAVDVDVQELVSIHAGAPIKIPVTITGRPMPKFSWTFEGPAETEKKNEVHTLPVDLQVNRLGLSTCDIISNVKTILTVNITYQYLQVRDTETTSVITIPESRQAHTGRFIISAENAAGHKNVKVRVAVLGKYNTFTFYKHVPLFPYSDV